MNLSESDSGPSNESKSHDLVLQNGAMFVQRTEIAILSEVLTCLSRGDSWFFTVVIPSGCCQSFVHTWQRMIHEPSYEENAAPKSYLKGKTAGAMSDQAHPPYLSSTVAYDRATSGYLRRATAYPSATAGGEGNPYSVDLAARVSVAFVGDNERGERRVCYLERIAKVDLSLDSFELDRVRVVFTCKHVRSMDSVLFVNDGRGESSV